MAGVRPLTLSTTGTAPAPAGTVRVGVREADVSAALVPYSNHVSVVVPFGFTSPFTSNRVAAMLSTVCRRTSGGEPLTVYVTSTVALWPPVALNVTTAVYVPGPRPAVVGASVSDAGVVVASSDVVSQLLPAW